MEKIIPEPAPLKNVVKTVALYTAIKPYFKKMFLLYISLKLLAHRVYIGSLRPDATS